MKNVMKSLAVAAAMMLSATAMADSYLYWMTSGASYSSWSTAKVVYDDGTSTGYLAPGVDGGTVFTTAQTINNEFYFMQVSIGSLVLSDSYKFALELYDGTSTCTLISNWVDYDAKYIGDASMSQKEALFTGFHIPEPTSGMLAMLGFGLLALRRKQK